MIHEMTGKVRDKVKGVVAISIALAGMTLAGQAQAGQLIAGQTHLTGDPVADGFTSLGTLHDSGVWVDSGSSTWAAHIGWPAPPADTGDLPLKATLYTGAFTLTANDTASSANGSFGDTIGAPVTLSAATGWQVNDQIFSIGVANLEAAPTYQHLAFYFKQTASAVGTPWAASSTSFNTPSVPDGNAGEFSGAAGTGPGDLHQLMFNSGTHNPYEVAGGLIQFKDSTGTIVSYGSPAGSTPNGVDPYLTFFNGDDYEGLLLINKSEVFRQWGSLGGLLRPGPFGDTIDFSLLHTDAGWFETDYSSLGVFFDVSTLGPALTLDVGIPEPASLALLGLGGLLMLRRRRTA